MAAAPREGGLYAFGGLLAAVLLLLLIATVIDLGQPRMWGTFTQTDCEQRPRGGCRPIGMWVSDDGRTILHDVFLDGWPGDGGITRASYQPTALLGTDVVHVPTLSGIGPWVIGGFLLWWVGYVLVKAAAWGDLTVPRSWVLPGRRRPRGPAGVSPRRAYREALAERSREGHTGESGTIPEAQPKVG
ncbi:hypothetical protein AB0O16_01635 [Microbacterium sp. NPDC089180]|uniref:hypothetical protein n=1 Tax=unclassified Microbacterium TaxID=2609290 RepID=UPI00343F4D50